MNKFHLLVITVLVTVQPSFSQTFQWVKSNTHSISFNPDYALFSSTTDAAGNFIIGTVHTFKLIYGIANYGDVIIRKYNSSGSQVLSKILAGKVSIKGIETDANSNIYVYGSFMDTLTIEPGNFILNTGSGLNLNFFLIKLNSSGSLVWKKNINVLYGSDASLPIIKIKGNSLYAGIILDNFQSWIKILDLNGSEISGFGQNPVRMLSAIDVDPQGNIFTAGSCQMGNVQFSNLNINCPYNYSLYFVKYNSSFQTQWVNLVEDVTFETPSLVCDALGNAYAAGDLLNDYIFGTIHTLGPQWVYDFYLTKMNSSGTFLWVKEAPHSNGSPTGDAALGKSTNLRLDNQNNVYIAGFQRGTLNWGPFTTTIGGITDVLVLKCDANGNFLWGKTAGGPNGERTDAISLDNTGNIFLSGNFGPTATFDTITVNGSGYINSYAAKLSNPPLGVQSYGNIIPDHYSLSNYPNPFNPETIIKFDIPKRGIVSLKIFDMNGKEISALLDNYNLDEGTYTARFDGNEIASGIYLYSLFVDGNRVDSRKMVLVK